LPDLQLSFLTDHWLSYPLTIADQQQHIALSEHLLTTALPGEPAILYWSVAEPMGIVLGFAQKPDVLNSEALNHLHLPVYHRRAGGTTVLVGPQLLSLDVVLPTGHPFILPDVVESYRWLGEVWVAALGRLGVQTRIVSADEAHAQQALRKQPETRDYEVLLHRSCYGTLSPYEVVVGRRKIVGLDMIRRRAGALLQAGVLLHWDNELLAQLLGHTSEEQNLLREGLAERAIGLDVVAGHTVSASEVIAAFEQELVLFEQRVAAWSSQREPLV
jgi:lipoate-protein ligase A